MKPLAILFLLLAGCTQVAAPQNPSVQTPARFTGKVTRIIDGDTIEVLYDGKVTSTRVRLFGIDAPERKMAFNVRAKEHLGQLIGDSQVRVVDHGLDQFERTLGDVYVDDKLLNLAMVRDGFAWHFKRYSDDHALSSAEIEAQAAKRGLWADPKPIPPWEWRENEVKK